MRENIYSNNYSDIIEDFPILSRKEELEIAKVILKYKGGKIKYAAREKLFNSNLRLVLKEAYYHRSKSNVPLDDLISAGSEGLWIATERFNPKKFKTKFSTYSIPWIRLGIYRLLNTFEHVVSVPIHVKVKNKKYREITAKDKIELTDKELMIELDVSKKSLGNIRVSRPLGVSLDQECSVGGDGTKKIIRDIVPDIKVLRPDVIALQKERKEIIHAALEILSPVEKDILISRYLKGAKDNLNKLGKKWGVTGERVRQIEHKALLRLKKRIKSRTVFNIDVRGA